MKAIAIALILLSPLGTVRAQTNDNAPKAARAAFTLTATIASVDSDRDRVIVLDDRDKRYTIDTYKSEIVLRGSPHAGDTGDLVRGMRVAIAGRMLSEGVISAERVRVLALGDNNVPLPSPAPPVETQKRIELRGTVTNVDERRGKFEVSVNHHPRTILLGDDTEVRGADIDTTFPVRTGDRVTVTGLLRADGAVNADVLTLGNTTPENLPVQSRTLTGRVSAPSDRILSRDIKIRLDDSGREVKILVPKNISIRHDGRALSVHELTKSDIVRVTGVQNGDNFRASRIDVIDTVSRDGRDDF